MSKSIKIVDYLIEVHLRNANGIQDIAKQWDDDNLKRLSLLIASTHDDVAKALLILKKTILKEYKIKKCRHPKKMRDMSSDGTKYCMNCNADL